VIDQEMCHLVFDPMMEWKQESDKPDLDKQDFPWLISRNLINFMIGDHDDTLCCSRISFLKKKHDGGLLFFQGYGNSFSNFPS